MKERFYKYAVKAIPKDIDAAFKKGKFKTWRSEGEARNIKEARKKAEKAMPKGYVVSSLKRIRWFANEI